jgi:PhnB protein
MTQQDDVKDIRNVIEDWAAGLRAKDASRVKRHGTGAMVQFSLAPPLVADESGPYGLEKWFSTWKGGLGYEIRDLEIVAGDGVAFSHSLHHLSGTKVDGEKPDIWFRHTFGFRKVGGDWKIVHSHESVPFLMDGSDKAAVDLKP